MKAIIYGVLLITTACFSTAGLSMDSEAAKSEITQTQVEEFQAYVRMFREEKNIPSLSVAVVKNGEIILLESIGFQDHDAEEVTTEDTSYLAASITKTFTSATLLGMEADGHIDLNADFTTLSDWESRCHWLTTSGNLFGGGTLDNGFQVPDLNCDQVITLRHVLQNQVNGTPGTSFFYNPFVFGRLSNWVEENTDQSWRYWMRKYVIEPAQLEHIAAGWRDADASSVLTHFAPPFKHTPEGSNRATPWILPNTELNASSGIIASAKALAQYSIALDEERIMPARLREQMWTPANDSEGNPMPYAYGWYVQSWKEHRLVWHGGWWPDAYAGLLLKAPDDGLALVALSNSDGLRHEIDSLTSSQIDKNPLALKFLETFVEAQ